VFAEVVGHEGIREVLGRAVQAARLPPALLLSGPDGVGKKTLALAVARGMLCAAGPGEPCGACSHCRRIERAIRSLAELREAAAEATDEPARLNLRLHPDLILVEPWRTATRTEIKIAQVRDLVSEAVGRPFEARARVFVVDEAHAMNDQAANALLKSLEEPPATSHLILVSGAAQALLPTIRSRCQILRMGPLPAHALEAYLRDRGGLAASEAHLRAALAGGSLGAALAFESDAYRGLREELLGILESAADGAERLDAAERLADTDDAILALTALRSLLRDVAALRIGVAREALLNADIADRLVPVSRGPVGERASDIAEAAAETRTALRGNAHKLLMMDLLMDVLAPESGRPAGLASGRPPVVRTIQRPSGRDS
jgi:DNA polymerase-3 subunit delta'